ncbi:type II toxin-antitoxin system RelE/ParE family toxin [bacterium]|nr:type II toxin-antitoxin system RelE/ParE family toxin [bacterium]
MSKTDVVFYADKDGMAPVDQWLKSLPKKIQAKGIARIFRLAEIGYELHRPEADYLQDGIYELRWSWQRVNYRILYFFHGQKVAVLAHSLTKEDKIPKSDLDIAIRRKFLFEQDPSKHTFRKEI